MKRILLTVLVLALLALLFIVGAILYYLAQPGPRY